MRIQSEAAIKHHRYQRVPDENEDVERGSQIKLSSIAHQGPSPMLLMIWLLALFSSTAIGFFCGFQVRSSQAALPNWTNKLNRVALGWRQQTLHYNKTFGLPPTQANQTEEAWDSMIPKGQGFVRYPKDNPQESAVSAVHQLHCLYSIRLTLFAELTQEESYHHPHGHQHKDTMQHMRHCFDLLRQTLMCCSDSSLEPYDSELGGVTGWGFPRVCRDYDELKSWAEQYRTNDAEGFTGAVPMPR